MVLIHIFELLSSYLIFGHRLQSLFQDLSATRSVHILRYEGSAARALPRAEPKGVKVGRSNEPFLDDKGH